MDDIKVEFPLTPEEFHAKLVADLNAAIQPILAALTAAIAAHVERLRKEA